METTPMKRRCQYHGGVIKFHLLSASFEIIDESITVTVPFEVNVAVSSFVGSKFGVDASR